MNDTHVAVYDETNGVYVWSGSYTIVDNTDPVTRRPLTQDELDAQADENGGFNMTPDVTKLSDLDLWRELTLNDLAEFDDPEDNQFATAIYSSDLICTEIDKRWGEDAMERVATLITGGKFDQIDELRTINSMSERWMMLVRGEIQANEWYTED